MDNIIKLYKKIEFKPLFLQTFFKKNKNRKWWQFWKSKYIHEDKNNIKIDIKKYSILKEE